MHPAATRGILHPVALGLAVLALAGCAGARGGHALDGRVWSAAAADFVEPAAVERAVRGADFVLLGETHDLPAHHAGQARLVRAAAAQRRPALVFEMIRRDQQPAIDRWRADGADPAALGAAVAWEARGWPDWSMYRPVVEAATALDLPLYGAAPPEALRRAVGRDGLQALDGDRLRELGLDRALPADGRRRLEAVLRAAHCGVGGDDMVAAMTAVQRLRDAFLAETLRRAAAVHGAAILIAGRGHTRADHGVPLYLRDGHRVTVGFAGTGEFDDLEALREAGGGAIAHDFVWFTPGGRPAPDCADRDSGHGSPDAEAGRDAGSAESA